MDALFDFGRNTRHALCMLMSAVIVLTVVAAAAYLAQPLLPQGYSVTVTQL